MNRLRLDRLAPTLGTQRPTLVVALGCVLGYLFLAEVGKLLDDLQGISSPFWPAAGLGLVVCYRYGLYGAATVYVASVLLQLIMGRPASLWVAVASSLGPAVAGYVAARVLHWLRFDVRSLSTREVLLLCAVAAPLGATVSAGLGLAPFFIDGGDPDSATLAAVQHWWLGDYAGILVTAPLALSGGHFMRVLRSGELRTFAWMMAGLGVVLLVSFPLNHGRNPMSWYIAAPVVWIAARFGILGAGVSVGLVSVVTLLSTSRGLGPFAHEVLAGDSYLYLQQFLCATAVSSHIVAVLSDERRGTRELERTRGVVREREQRLQLALEAGQMGLWTLDLHGPGGPQLLLDSYLCTVLRVSPDADPHEAWLASLRALPRREDRRRAQQALDDAYRDGESQAYDFQVLTAGNEPRWMSARVRRVFEHGLGRHLLAGVILDVTHLKRSEQALEHSHDMLAAALSASRTGLWQWNAAEDTISYSPECRQLMGLPDAESVLRGEQSLRQVHPEDLERVLRSRTQAIKTRSAWVSEFRVIRQGGDEVFWAEVRGNGRYDDAGRLVLMLGSLTDITERKVSETALRAATHGLAKAKKAAEELANRLEVRVRERTEELDRALAAAQAASQAKSEFLAHMSHEVRTPLTGMIAAADLLLHELPEGTHRARARMLRTSALSLKGLLDDVLDFARIEAGKLGLVESRFDPHELLSGVVELFSEAAHARGNRIELQTRGLPQACLADGARLRQVLVNLVGNAVKFTQHGRVRLEATYLPEGRLRLVVRDTGIGLTDEVKTRLFEPFEQADALQFGGTGLGLAISHRLVSAMGGRILADGAPGEGAQFTVEVPCKHTDVPAGAAQPQPRLPALRLLLAEDNAMNRTLIVSLLEQAGHQVDAVADGLQALDAVQRRAYDLVLMDVRMPRLDGREAVRRLRIREEGLMRMPVIALSADALELSRLKGDADFDALVAKPVDCEELFRVMAHVLQGAKLRRALPMADRGALDAGQPSDALLDARLLADLGERLGAERLSQMLGAAPGAFHDVARRLVNALRHGNMAERRDCAHELKGLAASLGCRQLARLAAELQSEPDVERIEALRDCVEHSVRALQSHAQALMPV